ncbi:hypothetical protein OPQ81_000904 [Rhizoctonia solani]|nr:hypothetical protein OPQ81_000904 [Rhizoctonia solani]
MSEREDPRHKPESTLTQAALQPVNLSTAADIEKDNEASWVPRKLVGSMTGRVVLSSYETLKVTSTSVVCISPVVASPPTRILYRPKPWYWGRGILRYCFYHVSGFGIP